MTVLDWILAAILGGFFIRGLFRGFFVELFDLVALVGGYFAARFLSPFVGEQLAGVINMPLWLAGVIAFVLVYIIVAVGIRLLALIMKKTADIMALGVLERLGGAVLGALKMVAVILALFLVLALTPLSRQLEPVMENGTISPVVWQTTIGIKDRLGWRPVSVQDMLPDTGEILDHLTDRFAFDFNLPRLVQRQEGLPEALATHAPPDLVARFLRQAGSSAEENAATLQQDLPREVQNELRQILENSSKPVEQRAEEFWNHLQENLPENVRISS